MRRRLTVAVLLCVCLAARGGRELEGVELIQTLAVDVSGEESAPGGVTLTAAGGEEERQLYQAAGGDVVEARENLKWAGARRLELTHVTHVILGQEVTLGDVLEREVTHRKSGYGARVWLAQGQSAQELLAGGEDDPAERLKSLEENAGIEAPTLLEALSQLEQEGEARLPVLTLADGELMFTGYETKRGTAK